MSNKENKIKEELSEKKHIIKRYHKMMDEYKIAEKDRFSSSEIQTKWEKAQSIVRKQYDLYAKNNASEYYPLVYEIFKRLLGINS